MSIEAFELAERFQTPVFVFTDLDLGMNNWMSDPFPYPEKPMNRGKVLTAETWTGWVVSRAMRMWMATGWDIEPYRAGHPFKDQSGNMS